MSRIARHLHSTARLGLGLALLLAGIAAPSAFAQSDLTPEAILAMDYDDWVQVRSQILQPEQVSTFIALCNDARERGVKKEDGTTALSVLYGAFDSYYRAIGGSGRLEVQEFIQNRMREFPDDRTWPVMNVNCDIVDAWHARGSGWASTVTDEGWELFRVELEKAYASLKEMLPNYPDDTKPYAHMITVCMGLSRPEEEIYGYLEKAFAIEPMPLSVVQNSTYAFSPRWLGSGPQLVELAEWSADRSKATCGDAMYIVVAHEAADTDDAPMVIDDFGFDVSRIVSGAKDYATKIYDDPVIRHRACQFVCIAGRQQEAATLFEGLEYGDGASDVWSLSAFQAWKKWSAGDGQKPETTPLHLAIEEMDKAQISVALQSGVDVNAVDENGHTAIQMAAMQNEWAVVDMLLAKGADPNLFSNEAAPPLLQAAFEGETEILAKLLKAGANPNVRFNRTAPLIVAADKNHVEIVKLLLATDGVEIEVADRQNFTPLFSACVRGNEQIILLMLEAGADPNRAANAGWTPLSASIQVGKLSIMKALVEHGADPYSSAASGWTATHMAIFAGLYDIADFLLSQPNTSINKPMADGWAAIHQVAKRGNTDVMEYILSKPDIEIDAQTPEGHTALIAAVREGHVPMVRLLLEHGADPSIANKAGKTPAQIADEKGYALIKQALTK